MKYTVGEQIVGDFYVVESSVRETKSGKPYINMSLRDKDGVELENCKLWGSAIRPEGIVQCRGTVEEFNGALQLNVKGVGESSEGANLFMPKAPWELSGTDRTEVFMDTMGNVENQKLKKFTLDFIDFWSKHRFPSMDPCEPRFSNHPGAQRNHHPYRHGLIEHVVEVMHVAACTSDLYKLSGKEDDLLMCGCAIHDIGKLEEIEVSGCGYQFGAMGKAYGWNSNAHLYIGSNMLTMSYAYAEKTEDGITEEEFLALNNIILSHHGHWSDVKPKYLISQIAHTADMASAQANRMKLNLAISDEEEIERDTVRESYLRL